MVKTAAVLKHTHNPHDGFDQFVDQIQRHFVKQLGNYDYKLFTTDIPKKGKTSLFNTYLHGFDIKNRQYHNCTACRHFFNTYGGLVCINDQNSTTSPIWHDWNIAVELPDIDHYYQAIRAVQLQVAKAKITGVFITDQLIWGERKTNNWTHYALTTPVEVIKKHPLLTSGQFMAEHLENYKILQTSLAEFNSKIALRAVGILMAENVYGGERILGNAKWFSELHQNIANSPYKYRDNIIWKAIAKAPVGFTHVRSSMFGTLLQDIKDGVSLSVIKRKFADKSDPTKLMRPQAAPTQGAIDNAEKIFVKLGLEPSLERRYARLDEVKTLWQSNTSSKIRENNLGIFSSINPKTTNVAAHSNATTQVMSWYKFSNLVLRDASNIQYYVPNHKLPLLSLVTAVNPRAKPIILWDFEDDRNPVSWYLNAEGSYPQTYNLTPNFWADVTAISLKPHMWNSKNITSSVVPKGVIFYLSGAKDLNKSQGLMLFPLILKSELHQVRSVIESYSNKGWLQENKNDPNACGIVLDEGHNWNNPKFKVTHKNGLVIEYVLDRWD